MRSSNFVITCMITDRIELHSVLLPLLIVFGCVSLHNEYFLEPKVILIHVAIK